MRTPRGWKANEWVKRRKQWIREHPPNFQGYWICYLCGRWVHETEMALDHLAPKSSTKRERAHSDGNLYPTHYLCNQEKGSRRVKMDKSFDFNADDAIL